MLNSSVADPQISALLDASAALARCHTDGELLTCIEHGLLSLTGSVSFALLWSVRGEQRLLASAGEPLPLPTALAQAQMREMQVAVEDEISFIPLLTHGRLHGWIAIRTVDPVHPSLTLWGAQCAAALAGLDAAASARERAAIDEIAQVLSSTLNLDLLLARISEKVRELIGARSFYVALLDDDRRELSFAYIDSPDAGTLPPTRRWSVEEGLTGLVVRSGEPVWTDDYVQECARRGVVPWSPTGLSFSRAWLAVPLRHHDRTLGVMVATHEDAGIQFDAADVQLLATIAAQAAAAVANAQLYGRTDEALAVLYAQQQQTVDRLTAVNALSLALSTGELSMEEVVDMAVAGAVGTTSGIAGGATVVLEGRPAIYRGASTGQAINWTAIAQPNETERDFVELHATQVPDDLAQEGVRRVVVVPLRGAKGSLGTLWIGYAQAADTQVEREMATLYAKMAGAVIESMYLAGVVRNAHDRMASILESTREGMLLVGEERQVAMVNRSFAQLIRIDGSPLDGHSVEHLCEEMLGRLPEEARHGLCEALNDVLEGAQDVAEGELRITGTPERELMWHILAVRSSGVDSNAALLVVRDVTADRQMERMRQDLANMIVHDLRSPLTNMMVSVDLLLKRTTGPLTESQARILGIASTSCQQMLDLVNALLDIRRLEQRTRDLQRQRVEIGPIIDMVIERLDRTAADRRIRLVSEIEPLPEIEADPDMIRRVLQNLVDNAVKFSPSGRAVVIRAASRDATEIGRAHTEGHWIVIAVQDEGVGIADEYHQVIFELFAQAPDGHGHGTGLGLAFCKLAVEAHGGQIWLQSAPGHGSTFFFSLPADG